jgi:hypothetical protein
MDEGSDATLRKNKEATMFPKMDEGTDVAHQKMNRADVNIEFLIGFRLWNDIAFGLLRLLRLYLDFGVGPGIASISVQT